MTDSDERAGPAGPAPTRVSSRFGESSLFRSGSGAPLLWLHAAGGAGAWDPFLERLSQCFDVFAPDHPGFGNSPRLDGVDSMPTLVEHYLSLLDGLSPRRRHVVGGSFGGWLAAELAIAAPERVDRLVLMAPAGLDLPDAPPAPLGTMTREEVVRALYFDQAKADAILAVPHTPEAAAQAQGDAAAAGMYFTAPYPELAPRLPAITAPTLVITPEVDNVIPRPNSEAYAAAIPGAELRVLPGIGHALYQENPDLVADEVIAFLTR